MHDILVIGAGGRIGKKLMASLGNRAIGVYRSPASGWPGFDLATQDLADVMVRPEGVTHAIILAGVANPEIIMANPSGAFAINVEKTVALTDRLLNWGIIPIFISSDAVLGLEEKCHSESAPVRPQTLYGQMKRQVEEALSTRAGDWLILRLPRVYGLEINDETLITSLFKSLMTGGVVSVACDQRFSPIYKNDMAQAIEAAVDRRLTGLYHLGGPQAVTHFQVAELLLAEINQRHPGQAVIKRCSINDFLSYEVRPLNMVMDSSKITAALGLKFITIEHACRVVAAVGMQNSGE